MSEAWLACSSVGVTLGASRPIEVLRDVTLDIGRGEFVAIVGPSGSGKSTLLHTLGCLRRPTSGSIVVCGHADPAVRARVRLRRSRIGFIFQDFNLFPSLTAEENVAEGLAYARRPYRTRIRMAREFLEVVGLGQRMKHRPNELSGGEQQRVAIARALVKEPDLLLADEPTGNLDSGVSDTVLGAIAKANNRGTTVVLVTHNPVVASRAARVIRIEDGSVVEASNDEKTVGRVASG